MTLITHDYAVILAKQTPIKHGFKYETTDIDLRQLTTPELNKLFLDAQKIEAQLQMCLLERG